MVYLQKLYCGEEKHCICELRMGKSEVHHEDYAKQINEKYHTNFTSRQVYHKFHKLKAQWKAKDKREKYINVPICWYDEMEFIFQDKHATGEFTVLQAPYDHPITEDTDFIGEKNGSPSDVDPSLHYDSDCFPEENNNGSSSSSKRPKGSKTDKGKRVKSNDNPILHITGAMNNMSDTMRFTHVTHPNEPLFKIIDEMVEYPTIV
uniref:Myb/SANT-like domain-containing protein n=1 Tax=Oryza punctata TaxID=4537 RepID=A0A0E0MKX1_ORYPU